MLIHGGCHCGNIAFVLDWGGEPDAIPARACTCSFCTRHGGVWTASSCGSLRVAVKDETQVSRYEFGTRTAQFHVCRTCGAVPVATSRVDDGLYAVVNVNTFEGVDPALLQHASASFDGESEGERLARRKVRWIGDVAFAQPPG